MGGLKDIWGVDDPDAGAAANSTQAKEFAEAFKAALADIARDLAYTAVHGEAARQAVLIGGRDTMIRQYQAARLKIVPDDPSKAKKTIADVLMVMHKLQTSVAAWHAEVEAAEKAWNGQEAEFETARAHIDELVDWGEPQAAQLHLDAETVQRLADAHDYRGAQSGAASLLSELAPPYAAYLAQKAAQAQYEPALLTLDPRMGEALQSSFATLQPRQQAIEALYKKTTDTAAAKDYVTALDDLGQLDKQVDDYVAARDELAAKKQAYEAARAPLEPRFPKADVDLGPGLAARRQAIAAAIDAMTAAAGAEDFDAAKGHADDLAPLLAEYENLVQQHDAYEKRRAEIQQRLPASTEAGAGRIAEVQDAIETSLHSADDSAGDADFTTATQYLDECAKHLDDLAAIVEARARFEDALAQLQPRLPTASEPGNGRLADVQAEIAQLVQTMQAAAAQTDYDTAFPALEALPPKLDEFEAQLDLRHRYDAAWAAVQPTLPNASTASSPKGVALQRQVGDLKAQAQAAAAKGDYDEALRDVEALQLALEDLATTQAAWEQAKQDVEKRYGALKLPLAAALENCAVPKEVQAAQKLVADCKADVDGDVAQGDYEAALPKLDALEQALNDYRDERRKTPRDCTWVLSTANELAQLIDIYYLQAQTCINDSAEAYDKALAEHKKALKRVSDAKQLAANIVEGIFFAALGGAVGGAVGVAAKNALASGVGKAFADSARGGAVVDATKDIAKFMTRQFQQFGGKPGDPTAGLSAFGGSGVELARKVGNAVNAQGVTLKKEALRLVRLVKANSATCATETLRVDGDPAEAVESDPFLKVLGGLVNADQKTFAKLLWAQWIENYAYTVTQICTEDDCFPAVEDNVEDFWGWWTDLTKSIEHQAGDDFGLRDRLNKARAVLEARINEAEANQH